MPKLLRCGLTVALLSCAGCFWTNTEKRPPAPVTTATIVQPPPPVTANQVTVENGHKIATSLGEELDREAQKAMLNPVP